MHLDIQARGFSLTEFLLGAVEERAEDFRSSFPNLNPQIQVRLFDVNGNRGGVDKGCLLHARLGRGRRTVVVSDVDRDMYRAIAAAFARLDHAARAHTRPRHRDRTSSLKLATEN